MLLMLLAGVLGGRGAQAQTPAALIYDPGVGAISFMAGSPCLAGTTNSAPCFRVKQ